MNLAGCSHCGCGEVLETSDVITIHSPLTEMRPLRTPSSLWKVICCGFESLLAPAATRTTLAGTPWKNVQSYADAKTAVIERIMSRALLPGSVTLG